jgi:YegS/Rv2252/BmrU family lipid kinase
VTGKTVVILHLKAAARPAVKNAIKTAISEGFDLRVLVPYDGEEVSRIVREAMDSGAERIIAGGGDGTLNAVVDTIVAAGDDKPDLTFGVFPLGTANDFARGCGLPLDDLTECLRIACNADGRSVDVGVLNGRNFINVASLGFGAEITATTPAQLKKALGGAAYTLTGLIKAMNLTPHSGRVLVPGGEDLESSILFAAVGNNRYAGGGFEVAIATRVADLK